MRTMKKEKFVTIPAKKIFKILKKYRKQFRFEIICPYCHSLTFIQFQDENERLVLDCYCEIPKNPTPKTLEIKLIPKFLPQGWLRRMNHKHEWFLESDKDSSQPIVIYLSKFDHSVDYRNKDGYQATLGEFAGRFCHVAPLRNTFRNALDDCYAFMKDHTNLNKIRRMLSEYSYNKKYQ